MTVTDFVYIMAPIRRAMAQETMTEDFAVVSYSRAFTALVLDMMTFDFVTS